MSSFLKRRPTANGRVPPKSPSVSNVTTNGPDTPEPDTTGADWSSSAYARKRKALLELVSSLKDLGAQTMLQLPRIAVIGSQSAGKSSLVEAVSGINVPRDSGTCTRCPMECSMSSSSQSWSCNLTLRFDYDRDGSLLQPSRSHPFGPTLTKKADLDIWLRRAQAAILSRHISPDEFLNKDYEELSAGASSDQEVLKFSKNVVVVNITDPVATDLSFVDLPGLIQNAEQHLIDLVRYLVVSYCSEQNTIILITIPMGDDMENQPAAKLAREQDPFGRRTMGVLTKPDTLSQGATNSLLAWKEVLEGQKHQLAHGYHCIRLPDDAERSKKLTPSESQRIAKQFFDSVSPWKDIVDRSRFGIPGLVEDLSHVLVQLIEESLPNLKRDVDLPIAECEASLAKLPPAPEGEPLIEIMHRVTDFCRDFDEAVFGGKNQRVLAHKNRPRYEKFKRDIHATAPDYRPFVNPENFIKPSYSQIPDDDNLRNPIPAVEVLGLEDIRLVIKDAITWELPFIVPYEATKELVQRFTRLWHEPTISCFNDVFDVLKSVIADLESTHFGRYKMLKGFISSLIGPQIELSREQAFSAMIKLLDLEKDPLYTVNIEFLIAERKKWESRYHGAYERQWLHDPSWIPSSNVPAIHPLELYQDELNLMSYVRAFFQIAYKRIIDSLPRTIEHSLNQDLAIKIKAMLSREFLAGSISRERMKDLLSEDPVNAKLRELLEGKMRRLHQIKRKLENFMLDNEID